MAAQTVEALALAVAVETISTEADFLALRETWNELLENSASNCVFLTWEWLSCWWKHLKSDYCLSIRLAREGTRLIAIAPFAVRSAQPLEGRLLPTVEFLGSGFVGSDYLDIIIRTGYEEAAISALAAQLKDSGVALRLSNVLVPDSAAAQLVSRCTAEDWKTDRIEINVCPYLPLEGHTWDFYLASLGSETRYNFNRKWKRLNRDFTVEFALATPETLAESLATAIEQHNARWNERGGSDAFHQRELVRFHEEFTCIALKRGWLRLFTLKLNGEPAASLYGLLYNGKFYFYQSGLNPTYEKQSVGFLTMGLAIQRAISENAREYDLLHGAESYKFHWTALTRPIYRLESWPPGAGGSAARSVFQLGRISRTMARRVLRSTRSDSQLG